MRDERRGMREAVQGLPLQRSHPAAKRVRMQ